VDSLSRPSRNGGLLGINREREQGGKFTQPFPVIGGRG
jgi:hypothetical protein